MVSRYVTTAHSGRPEPLVIGLKPGLACLLAVVGPMLGAVRCDPYGCMLRLWIPALPVMGPKPGPNSERSPTFAQCSFVQFTYFLVSIGRLGLNAFLRSLMLIVF